MAQGDITYTGRIMGVSPYASISGEDMQFVRFHKVVAIDVDAGSPSPPLLADGNASSSAMTMWIQPHPFWNFSKVVEPRYEGISSYLGAPSNEPDHIKEFHLIGLMRNVDHLLKPNYVSHLYVSTNLPAPIPPPTT